jgi:hypothetical protein
METNKPKYIAQGLLKTWKEEKEFDTSTCKVAPLMYFLKFNYEERYVKLCRRLDIEPVSFGKWLSRPIESV